MATWPVNPFGPANPFADAVEIIDAAGGQSIHRRRQLQLDPLEDRAPEPPAQLVGGADLASFHDLLYAPPTLQVEQHVPTGLPGDLGVQHAQINYINYSINLIHHYTGLSWLDATTSAGFERDAAAT